MKRLSAAQELLVKTGADLKLVKPSNIHITIRFLGNISLAIADRIFEEMKKVQFSSFNLQVKGIGAFPKPNYPRIIWVGIKTGVEQLKSVFNQLEPRLRSFGFMPDSKGFTPHLTIARVRSARNKMQLASVLTENTDYEFGIINVKCLRLKKSELTPRGPIYSTLREFCPEKQKREL